MPEMTSAERFACLQEGRRPDRVPVAPFVQAYAARLVGLPLKDFYTQPALAVRAQILARDLHGYDSAPGFGWADWGAWEFGGRVRFPESYEDASPRTAGHLISKPSDVDKLEVPDPATAGWFPMLMEFNRLTTELGYRAKIMGGSPTNVVAAIIGTEKLLRWYIQEKKAVHAAYEKATELIIRGADLVIREFGSNCSFGYGAPLEANNLISSKIFEEFAWPYLKRLHQAMLDRGVACFGVHLCGDHRDNLQAWAALPWPPRATISVGSDMDLIEVAEAFGHRPIVAGNVSTTSLACGSYDEVIMEARRCLEKAKDLPGGYLLMPDCEMPVMAPPINVHALLQAARKFGRYG